MSKVKVEVLRDYPVGRVTYRPGRVIEVEPKVADALAKTRPPFARRLKEPKAPKPAPKKDAGGE